MIARSARRRRRRALRPTSAHPPTRATTRGAPRWAARRRRVAVASSWTWLGEAAGATTRSSGTRGYRAPSATASPRRRGRRPGGGSGAAAAGGGRDSSRARRLVLRPPRRLPSRAARRERPRLQPLLPTVQGRPAAAASAAAAPPAVSSTMFASLRSMPSSPPRRAVRARRRTTSPPPPPLLPLPSERASLGSRARRWARGSHRVVAQPSARRAAGSTCGRVVDRQPGAVGAVRVDRRRSRRAPASRRARPRARTTRITFQALVVSVPLVKLSQTSSKRGDASPPRGSLAAGGAPRPVRRTTAPSAAPPTAAGVVGAAGTRRPCRRARASSGRPPSSARAARATSRPTATTAARPRRSPPRRRRLHRAQHLGRAARAPRVDKLGRCNCRACVPSAASDSRRRTVGTLGDVARAAIVGYW